MNRRIAQIRSTVAAADTVAPGEPAYQVYDRQERRWRIHGADGGELYLKPDPGSVDGLEKRSA